MGVHNTTMIIVDYKIDPYTGNINLVTENAVETKSINMPHEDTTSYKIRKK